METTSGEKHDETKGETVTQLAVRMRADIEELQRAGTIPETLDVSVRSRHGSSIDIVVTGLRDAETWTDQDNRSRDNMTPAGRAIFEALERVHGAYDQSLTYGGQDYSNHRYYGSVKLLTEEDQAWEARQREERLARTAKAREAREAAEAAPLRATLKRGKPVELAIAKSVGGEIVGTVVLEKWRNAEALTTSEVEYLLDRAGWKVLGFVRRSKTNPVRYWTVERTGAAPEATGNTRPDTPAVEAPEREQPPAEAAVDAPPPTPPAPAAAPMQPPAATPPRDKLAEAVAQLGTEQIVQMLGKISRRRTVPTVHEAAVGRALVGELRTRVPAAFDAVADVDPGDRAYLRELVKAAQGTPPAPRRTPAKDDRELCEADPRARPIELDGTGLSGTHCPTPVNRRRPLIAARPELGSTTGAEKCMELATWSLPGEFATPPSGLAQGFCTTHAAAKLRERPLPQADEPEPEPAPEREAATAEPEEAAAEDDDAWNWDGLTLHYSTDEGTLLFGTSESDGALEALTDAGQHWKRARGGPLAGELFVPRSRGRERNVALLAKAEEVLVAAGFKVRREVVEAPRVAEARADERERGTARAERYAGYAEGAAARSEGGLRRSAEIGERFAEAQPIVGSRAVRASALRDKARMHAADAKGWEEGREAKHWEERAKAAAAAVARKDEPLKIARRIAKAEAELWKIGAAWAGESADSAGAEQRKVRAEHLEAQLELDRAALAVHVEEKRWRIVERPMVAKGDAVLTPSGWDIADKVNPKKVEIESEPGMTLVYGYHEIGDHRTAAQLAEARARRAQRQAAARAQDTATE